MFDLGFSELLLIGAVALVVLGPERLPVAAKTAGRLYGKARRLIEQVKIDVERETEFQELKKIKSDTLAIATDVQKTLKENATELVNGLDEVESEVIKKGQDFWSAEDAAVAEVEAPSIRFDKRWKSGPTLDELAEEVIRLKSQLGEKTSPLGAGKNRLTVRARTNRVRIYR